MARTFSLLVAPLLVVFLGYCHADPEYCDRGFLISSKFHTCWETATAKRPFSQLHKIHAVYTPQLLELYASHMCSVVKPLALDCLKNEVSSCSNMDKLLATADSSGGACTKNHLNPLFKQHIIDHLKPIRGDSPCFDVADQAYKCYEMAGEKILKSGVSHINIDFFYKVADKFFGYIWDCHVDLFKGMSDVCENWQIPMLFSLQQNAMPSLFGMKLDNYQISKLELSRNKSVLPVTTPAPVVDETCKNARVTSYLLMRVVKDKREAQPGDILVQLDAGGDLQSELTVDGGPDMNDEVYSFVADIVNSEGGIDMKALRKKLKEDRKKQREVNDFLKNIKKKESKNKKKAAKKPKAKGTQNDGMIN
ncbi:uncharacterized protein LOC101851998 [Aplysia californica]|uniref:Uncharacterized protein LOC101851998 n=1 Tax=Aplysia californica TaxID=6500 RepID=A0ABM0JDP2_APLCA|nr:uncharacterized protein LOC101851998 [Aplysia californica]